MQKLFGVTRWQNSRPNLFLFCKSKHSIFHKCLSSEVWILLNARSIRVSPQKIQVQIVWGLWWITRNLLLGMVVWGVQMASETTSTGQCKLCVPRTATKAGCFSGRGAAAQAGPGAWKCSGWRCGHQGSWLPCSLHPFQCANLECVSCTPEQ